MDTHVLWTYRAVGHSFGPQALDPKCWTQVYVHTFICTLILAPILQDISRESGRGGGNGQMAFAFSVPLSTDASCRV